VENYINIENSFLVASENHMVITLDASKVRSIDEVMRYLSVNMSFPNYFSHNLNSFEECINDLEWLEDKKIVLIISNSKYLLTTENPSVKESFIEVLLEWNKNYEKAFLIIDSKTEYHSD
jgi:hypothetical protein